MNTQLPGGWSRVALGHVGTWTGGGTPSKADPRFWTAGTVPWVSPKDMKVPVLHRTEDYITEAALHESAARIVQAGSVLLVTRSGILQRTLPVAVNAVPVALNQDMKAVTPKEGIESRFLYWLLVWLGDEILRDCAKAGTTVASIEMPRLMRLEVPMAPIAEQRRIVAALEEHLSALDAAVAGLERARAHLSTYRAAVVEHVIRTEPGIGWRKATVGDLCEWSSGDYLPQKSFAPGVVPVYGGNGVSGTHAVPNVNAPTLVIGRVGAHCGNVHLTAGPAWITDNAIYAKRVDESLTLPFLGLVLSAARLNAKAAGSGQPFVNQRMLNETDIALPALSEQRHIIEEVERCVARANRVEDDIALQLVRTSRLRKSILHRAFSGRLVKQDANDEQVPLSSSTAPTAVNRPRTRAAGRRPRTSP